MHIRFWSGALIVLAMSCTSEGDLPAVNGTESQVGGSAGKVASTGGSAGEAIGSAGSAELGGS